MLVLSQHLAPSQRALNGKTGISLNHSLKLTFDYHLISYTPLFLSLSTLNLAISSVRGSF